MGSRVNANCFFVRRLCATGGLRSRPEESDYFDVSQRGFLLEVRQSGGKTYYQRYTDERGRERQYKIGPAEVLTLDQARARENRSLQKRCLARIPNRSAATCARCPSWAGSCTSAIYLMCALEQLADR